MIYCKQVNFVTCCYDRFYDLLSTMMSEGGKAPTGAVHNQEEIHVICSVLYHTCTYVRMCIITLNNKYGCIDCWLSSHFSVFLTYMTTISKPLYT